MDVISTFMKADTSLRSLILEQRSQVGEVKRAEYLRNVFVFGARVFLQQPRATKRKEKGERMMEKQRKELILLICVAEAVCVTFFLDRLHISTPNHDLDCLNNMVRISFLCVLRLGL